MQRLRFPAVRTISFPPLPDAASISKPVLADFVILEIDKAVLDVVAVVLSEDTRWVVVSFFADELSKRLGTNIT